jgi:hypothetical protein
MKKKIEEGSLALSEKKKQKKKEKGFLTLYKRGLQRRKMGATVQRKIKRNEGRTESFCTGDLSLISKFFLFLVFSFILRYVF